jgi:hypothetical protein
MRRYRGWVYKMVFWLFGEIAAHVGLLLSGDVFWKEGVEFSASFEEIKDKG